MGRFDRSDDEWLRSLQLDVLQEARERDDATPASTWLCGARGPAGVRCDQPLGHEGDHSGEQTLPKEHEGLFAAMARERPRFRRSTREFGGKRQPHTEPKPGTRLTWPQGCDAATSTDMGRVTCKLPKGHTGVHAAGPYEWS